MENQNPADRFFRFLALAYVIFVGLYFLAMFIGSFFVNAGDYA